MKTQFGSLTDFAKEIEQLENAKQDYLVSGSSYHFKDDNTVEIEGKGNFNANNHFHGQIAAHYAIPKQYYDAMSYVPGLRKTNVNAWIDAKNGSEKRLVRTINDTARAFVSDKYRPIDNYFLMSAFLPVIQDLQSKGEIDKVETKASALTERKLYLQVAFPGIEGEVKKDDVVKWGIVLSNSEVGCGSVAVNELLWRLICDNGMIGESVMRKHHVGKRITENDMNIFANDTIKAELNSFKLRLRDILRHALSRKSFEDRLDQLRAAANDEIKKPLKTVENVTQRFTEVSKDNIEQIVENMASEGNMNRYGLANGITALARDLDDADKAYELERAGNKIIELKPSEWEAINVVAA